MTRAMAIVLALAAWPLSTSAFVNTKGRGLTNMARPLTAGRRNTATPLSMSAPAAEGKVSEAGGARGGGRGRAGGRAAAR